VKNGGRGSETVELFFYLFGGLGGQEVQSKNMQGVIFGSVIHEKLAFKNN